MPGKTAIASRAQRVLLSTRDKKSCYLKPFNWKEKGAVGKFKVLEILTTKHTNYVTAGSGNSQMSFFFASPLEKRRLDETIIMRISQSII